MQDLEAAVRQPRKPTAYEQKVAGLPKVEGAVRMFRTWELREDNRLEAMTNHYIWSPGQNAADMSTEHHAGFYGFGSLNELRRQEKTWWEHSQSGKGHISERDIFTFSLYGHERPAKPKFYVCGTILGYGHVKIAQHGGKAQYAVPEYIIEPEGCDPDFGLRIVNVAEKYDMKIISVKQAKRLKAGKVAWWKGKSNR